MDRISTYQIAVNPEVLRETASEPVMAQSLHGPMQALLHAITSRRTAGPIGIYLCSPDDEMRLRVDFASALTRTIAGQIPSTLLVDCDFRNVGLGGIVPEKDALGFLDFLLYGSSLGVITQETEGGLRVIGAGSFPVTKRMPFVLNAFDESSHRLCAHARCVVFAGPMLADDGEIHPLVGACDLTVLVRSGERLRPGIDASEERMVSGNETDLLSVRVVPPVVPKPESVAPVPTEEPEEILPSPMPPVIEPRKASADVAPLPGSGSRGAGSGRGWMVAVFVAGLVLAIWWWQSRQADEVVSTGTTPSHRQSTGTAEPVRQSAEPAAQAATPVETTGTRGEVAEKPPERPASGSKPRPRTTDTETARPSDLADTGGLSGGQVLIPSFNIIALNELEDEWKDWFLVHISSFRESVRAREEIAYLESLEFPVFIVFLDLGAKGKWYRVYGGPYQVREEARDLKKDLDEISRVKFTRIVKVGE